ncbi:MAG: hypothetical protein SF187_14950 [Deltaproteobacteria bacterium]|nr:hypothetical protein [Deltaproteobacteria bacterium]
MISRLVRLFLSACALVAVFAVTKSANAYPQWQFTSGTTRCNQCHFNPAGGGLLRGYGRDAAGEDLATFDGNGGFLHGAVELPDWLAIGGDFRLALASQNVGGPNGTETALFPMQADVYTRIAMGESFSLNVTGGIRGQARVPDEPLPAGSYEAVNGHRAISREHFVMWQPAAQGWYARAGRFFAPFGLRFAEHILYIRRDLGFNLLQETYNVSGGYISNDWELHITAFGPDLVQKLGARESGAAAYYERRLFEEKASVAVQAKFSTVDGTSRIIGGLVARYFIEPARLMFLGEANIVNNRFDGPAAQNQLVGAAGFTFLPWNSLMFTALGERLQTAIQVKDSATNAATGLLNWFPYPHVEMQLVGRMQMPTGQGNATTILLQVHYYL